MTESLKRTPLFDRQQQLGARFVPFAGWEMPIQFEGVAKEHAAARNAAGVFDVSHMGELWVRGPGATEAVNRLITRDLERVTPGHAVYTLCCGDDGRILDDLIVYRVSEQQVLTVCNASNVGKIGEHYRRELQGDVTFTDESDATALLAVQGPSSVQLLDRLFHDDPVGGVPRFGIVERSLAGHRVLAARTGYSGEDGFELFVAQGAAALLWDAILAAGEECRVAPMGLGARDTLRLEAGLRLYGQDIDESTGAYEAGLGWTIDLDKPAFIGQRALRQQHSTRPKRRLVGFEMVERGIARSGYDVVDTGGTILGKVTSGAPALTLGKNIGMAYVPAECSKPGTKLGVAIRQKVVEAVVCKMPFYRRSE